MSNYPENIAELIKSAHTSAEAGDMEEALQRFREARRACTESCDVVALARLIKNAQTRLDAERVSFSRGISLRNASSLERIVVFADSLGLPAFEEKTTSDPAFDRTYSYVLTNLAKRGQPAVRPRVTPFCRRYATMADVATMLSAPDTLAACSGANVLVHIGLNDTAIRMFMEDQRISLSLLPEPIRALVLQFAQKYRHQIILSDLDHSYVPHSRFIDLVDRNIVTLKRAGAKTVTLATVILPPSKFWHATPLITWNFGRYNQALADAARRHDVHLLDIGHLMWEGDCTKTLRADGMHLAKDGYELMARRYVALLDQIGWGNP